jgi:hypothetical protein
MSFSFFQLFSHHIFDEEKISSGNSFFCRKVRRTCIIFIKHASIFLLLCDDHTMNIFLRSSTTESSMFHRYVETSGYNRFVLVHQSRVMSHGHLHATCRCQFWSAVSLFLTQFFWRLIDPSGDDVVIRLVVH